MASLAEITAPRSGTKSRWLMLAVIFTVRIVVGFQGQTLGSLAPQIVRDLGIDFTQLGALLGLGSLPGVVLAIPAAMLGQRFGDKRVSVAALGMMVAGGVLMSVGADLGMLAAGRLISGAGSILLNVLLTKMVIEWFAGRELVAAMALSMSSYPTGVSLGLVLLGPMATIMPWQTVMIVAAATCAASLLLLLVAYRDPPDEDVAAAATPTGYRLSVREFSMVGLAAFIWSLFNVAFNCLPGFGPAYLTASGYGIADAGQLISIAIWLSIPSIQLGGIVAQKLGRPNLIILGSLLITSLVMLAIPFSPNQMVTLAVWGLVFGIPVGNIMALVPSIVPPQARSTAMGIFYAGFYALQAAVTPLAGATRDLTHNPAAPIAFGAGALFSCIIALVFFHALHRKPALSPSIE